MLGKCRYCAGLGYPAASGFGGIEKALEWFENAYQQRNPNMPYVGMIPFSATVRDDPRFTDLLRRKNPSGLLAER